MTIHSHFVGEGLPLPPILPMDVCGRAQLAPTIVRVFYSSIKILCNIALLLICGTPRMSSPTINWAQFENSNITSLKIMIAEVQYETIQFDNEMGL